MNFKFENQLFTQIWLIAPNLKLQLTKIWGPKYGPSLTEQEQQQEEELCKTSSRHCSLKSGLDLASLVGKLGLGCSLNDKNNALLRGAIIKKRENLGKFTIRLDPTPQVIS